MSGREHDLKALQAAIDQNLELGASGAAGVRGNSTGSVVIYSAGSTIGGLVIIRPNGSTATVTQTVFNTDGSITFGGDATAKAVTRASLGAAAAPGAWTDVAFSASYKNLNDASGTFGTCQHRLVDGTVQLRGLMSGVSLTGANPVTAFTLPVGSRPAKRRVIHCGGDGTTSAGNLKLIRLDVETTGVVTVDGAFTSVSFISLDGASFSL